jgi:plasmid maintenance system antidote protein VapI
MGHAFRDAFVWHFETLETKIAELVRATGISRDVINKLLAREGSSTSAENALLIAGYYGKTLEAFVSYDSRGDFGLPALAELLTDDEAKIVAAQVRGILA